MAVASHLISRMPALASIRASVLIPLVQQIDKRSGKTDLLLASHGILRSQLEDPYAVLPMARYVALFEEAATITGEPALGARMGTGFKPADIGPIGMLFALSPTIRSAFERLSKYVNAVGARPVPACSRRMAILSGATGSSIPACGRAGRTANSRLPPPVSSSVRAFAAAGGRSKSSSSIRPRAMPACWNASMAPPSCLPNPATGSS